MKTTYQIIQLFRSAYCNTEHVIFSHQSERQARKEFNLLKEKLPDEYFELLEIKEEQALLEYTPITDDGWLAARGLNPKNPKLEPTELW